MQENTNSDKSVSTEETKVEETKVVETEETITEKEPSQIDPVKAELEKVQKKGKGRTELEKAIFTKQQIEKRIAELKGDTDELNTPDEDDTAPVTVGMLKKMQKEQTVKSALSLAEEQITDESELELVKHHLQNTIKPSGNAGEDFRNARALVNAVKNTQILEEVDRKPKTVKRTSSGSSAPGKHEEVFEPTADELKMMSFKGFDGKPLLTKEDVIKARKQEVKG